MFIMGLSEIFSLFVIIFVHKGVAAENLASCYQDNYNNYSPYYEFDSSYKQPAVYHDYYYNNGNDYENGDHTGTYNDIFIQPSPKHNQAYIDRNGMPADIEAKSGSPNMKEKFVPVVVKKKKKKPITDAPRGSIYLGTQLFGSIEQKGVKNLPSCLKKCATLGPGTSPAPADLAGPLFGDHQLCFGINYDFATHKCYFVIYNHPRIEMTTALAAFAICPIVGGQTLKVPVDLQPNPTTVTIILCPPIGVAPPPPGGGPFLCTVGVDCEK